LIRCQCDHCAGEKGHRQRDRADHAAVYHKFSVVERVVLNALAMRLSLDIAPPAIPLPSSPRGGTNSPKFSGNFSFHLPLSLCRRRTRRNLSIRLIAKSCSASSFQD
jgi:hypothetical protein